MCCKGVCTLKVSPLEHPLCVVCCLKVKEAYGPFAGCFLSNFPLIFLFSVMLQSFVGIGLKSNVPEDKLFFWKSTSLRYVLRKKEKSHIGRVMKGF